jgi:HD-GYP domain-containing protein (c-di-GMP phosphodiesterase class II)
MLTAKALYGNDNKLMLSENRVLAPIEIERIRSLGFQGMYIHDEISRNIEVTEIINAQLKNNTVKAIKSIFTQAENVIKGSNMLQMQDIQKLLDNIVNEISSNDNATINMLDLKTYDNYTYYHSVNVAVIAIVMGMALKYSQTQLYELGLAALLHDIGKIFVPFEVIDKKGKLTDEEFSLVKDHSVKGIKYLKERWSIPIDSIVAILNHHERYDGSGYPYKLKKNKISEYGKILAVADVYDALTSNRAYRQAYIPSDAMEYVMGGSGIMFDPGIVNVFAKKVVPYPVGICIILSNGLQAIVVENYSNYSLRPKIKLITENNEDIYLDLCNDINLLDVTIVGVLNI